MLSSSLGTGVGNGCSVFLQWFEYWLQAIVDWVRSRVDREVDNKETEIIIYSFTVYDMKPMERRGKKPSGRESERNSFFPFEHP